MREAAKYSCADGLHVRLAGIHARAGQIFLTGLLSRLRCPFAMRSRLMNRSAQLDSA